MPIMTYCKNSPGAKAGMVKEYANFVYIGRI